MSNQLKIEADQIERLDSLHNKAFGDVYIIGSGTVSSHKLKISKINIMGVKVFSLKKDL